MISKKAKECIGLFSAIILIDQIAKIWVKTNLSLGQSIHVFDWFLINFQENNGMAFSIELFDKIFLTLFRIVAVCGITWLIRKVIREGYTKGFAFGLTAVLAGAVGNIIDCMFYGVCFSSSLHQVAEFLPAGGGYAPLFYGKVVDMLYFPLIQSTFPEWMPFCGGEHFIFFRPVFNIADSAICIGVFYLLIFQTKQLGKLMSEDDDKKASKETETNESAEK